MIINKQQSIIKDDYIWINKNDKEFQPNNIDINIEGVLKFRTWSNNIYTIITDNNIMGIEIQNDKYTLSKEGLSFLKDLPHLKYLRITGKYKKSEYKYIENLSNLEQLSLGDYEAYELDFSNLKNLISYFSIIKNENHPVFKLRSIEHLGTNTTLESFQAFSQMKKLTTLYLFARKLSNLNSISNLTQLKTLSIDYSSHLKSISHLHLPSLEELYLYSCGEIESLQPLKLCKKLKFLSFMKTKIKDNDINILVDLPLLKEVNFENRIGYSLKKDEVVQAIAN